MSKHVFIPLLTLIALLSACVMAAAESATPPQSYEQSGVRYHSTKFIDGRLVTLRRDVGREEWRLYASSPGSPISELPVQPFSSPVSFDVSFNPGGRPTASLVRCRASGCYGRQVDLVRRTETGLRPPSTGERLQQLSRYRESLAFVSTRAGRPSVWVARLGAPSARRVLGPFSRSTKVEGITLAQRGLAATVTIPKGEGHQSRLYLKPTNRPVRLLHRVSSGLLSQVILSPPQWQGNNLYWTYARRYDRPAGLLLRANVSSRGVRIQQASIPGQQGGENPVAVGVDSSSSDQPLWFQMQRGGEEAQAGGAQERLMFVPPYRFQWRGAGPAPTALSFSAPPVWAQTRQSGGEDRSPAQAESALSWALKHVGVRERGTSNCSPVINRWEREMGLKLPPCRVWCGAFVHQAYLRAGVRLSERLIDPHRSYADASAGRRHLRKIEIAEIQPGDLVFYKFREGVRASHLALARARPENGKLQTVEGNVSNASSLETRGTKYIVLAARVTR